MKRIATVLLAIALILASFLFAAALEHGGSGVGQGVPATAVLAAASTACDHSCANPCDLLECDKNNANGCKDYNECYSCCTLMGGGTEGCADDCRGQFPLSVGGMAELPDIGRQAPGEATAPAEESGWSGPTCAALAAGLAAAAVFITVGGWYARRRWLNR
jgi:hypothetical protein